MVADLSHLNNDMVASTCPQSVVGTYLFGLILEDMTSHTKSFFDVKVFIYSASFPLS